jgi:outer membrane protein assembly factor BamD (BamD/ComL family)
LNYIRSLAKNPNTKSLAIEQLEKLIKQYPKTEAAKDAQTLLKNLQ